jgi:Rps23 Pro-64 3,4-dihydroxylase Tpa1-like proline 4-hydroxylase
MTKEYIKVYDGVYDEELIYNAEILVKKSNYTTDYNYISKDPGSLKYNWSLYNEKRGDKEILDKTIKSLWEKTKELLPVKDYRLKRAYINVSRFGDEDRIHTDGKSSSSGLTAIVYLSGKWKITWGGQTNFYTKFTEYKNLPNDDETEYENEIIHSVIPKQNRVLIFNSKIPHSAGMISKSCLENRYVCVFKILTANSNYEQ